MTARFDPAFADANLESIWSRACPDPIGPWDDLWRLYRAGVPADELRDVGAINAQIRRGRWVEDQSGHRAIILPVMRAQELIDLVAFRLETPLTFFSHEGLAAVLGVDELERAAYFAQPLTVLESPLDWLRARRRGVVVINHEQFWPFHLAGIPALRCTSVEFGRRLRATLQRPFAIPEIQVPT